MIKGKTRENKPVNNPYLPKGKFLVHMTDLDNKDNIFNCHRHQLQEAKPRDFKTPSSFWSKSGWITRSQSKSKRRPKRKYPTHKTHRWPRLYILPSFCTCTGKNMCGKTHPHEQKHLSMRQYARRAGSISRTPQAPPPVCASTKTHVHPFPYAKMHDHHTR